MDTATGHRNVKQRKAAGSAARERRPIGQHGLVSVGGDHLLTLSDGNPIQKLVDSQLRILGVLPNRGGALQNIHAWCRRMGHHVDMELRRCTRRRFYRAYRA